MGLLNWLTDRTLHGNGDWLTLVMKRGYMSKHKNVVQAGLSDTVSLEQVSLEKWAETLVALKC